MEHAEWRSDKGIGLVFIPASDTNRIRAFHRDGELYLIVSQDAPRSLNPGDRISGRVGIDFVSDKAALIIDVPTGNLESEE